MRILAKNLIEAGSRKDEGLGGRGGRGNLAAAIATENIGPQGVQELFFMKSRK